MNKVSSIPVITAVNDAYVLPLAVMLRSAALSSNGSHLDCRILTTGISPESHLKLEKSLGGLNIDISEVIVDISKLRGLKVDGHVSLETYFRILAPCLLADLDKVLYLDADLIVRHSIRECFNENLGGAHLLAVPHSNRRSAYFGSERGIPSHEIIGVNPNTRTFNAGVMILNLELWRQTNTTGEILRYLQEYKEYVLWWDQDGLNAALYSKWRPLHPKWNVLVSSFAADCGIENSILDALTFESVRRDPGIVHYASSVKPWMSGYNGAYGELWRSIYEPIAGYFLQ